MVVFGNLAILHESKICGRDVRGDEGGAMLLKLTFKVVVIVTSFFFFSIGKENYNTNPFEQPTPNPD